MSGPEASPDDVEDDDPVEPRRVEWAPYPRDGLERGCGCLYWCVGIAVVIGAGVWGWSALRNYEDARIRGMSEDLSEAQTAPLQARINELEARVEELEARVGH